MNDDLRITKKVIWCLASQKLIATQEWLQSVLNLQEFGLSFERINSLCPPVDITGYGPLKTTVSLSPNPLRENLFKGLQFVVFCLEQLERISISVEACHGGDRILIEPPPEISETDAWNYIKSHLKSKKQRPIQEEEIGFAILYVSTSIMCNPHAPAYSLLIDSISQRSKSANSKDASGYTYESHTEGGTLENGIFDTEDSIKRNGSNDSNPFGISDSMADTLPLERSFHTADTIPLDRSMHLADTIPLGRSVCMADTLPIESTTPLADTIPLDRSNHKADAIPLRRSFHTADTPPTETTTPLADTIPLDRSIHMADTIPLDRSIHMADTIPLDRSIHMADTIPLDRSIHMTDTQPMEQTTPLADTIHLVSTMSIDKPSLSEHTMPANPLSNDLDSNQMGNHRTNHSNISTQAEKSMLRRSLFRSNQPSISSSAHNQNISVNDDHWESNPRSDYQPEEYDNSNNDNSSNNMGSSNSIIEDYSNQIKRQHTNVNKRMMDGENDSSIKRPRTFSPFSSSQNMTSSQKKLQLSLTKSRKQSSSSQLNKEEDKPIERMETEALLAIDKDVVLDHPTYFPKHKHISAKSKDKDKSQNVFTIPIKSEEGRTNDSNIPTGGEISRPRRSLFRSNQPSIPSLAHDQNTSLDDDRWESNPTNDNQPEGYDNDNYSNNVRSPNSIIDGYRHSTDQDNREIKHVNKRMIVVDNISSIKKLRKLPPLSNSQNMTSSQKKLQLSLTNSKRQSSSSQINKVDDKPTKRMETEAPRSFNDDFDHDYSKGYADSEVKDKLHDTHYTRIIYGGILKNPDPISLHSNNESNQPENSRNCKSFRKIFAVQNRGRVNLISSSHPVEDDDDSSHENIDLHNSDPDIAIVVKNRPFLNKYY
ncbi:hypothetical protein BDB01DRAFT_136526 [Pilobolus umbonatus]|nr:hypothetical protein BDB01DRAFT_136526 [Pilobolus umbonatus]